MSASIQQHALDALALSAKLAEYGAALLTGKLPDCFALRDIAHLADTVFEQDVSNYGPFGDATIEANDIDEQEARAYADEGRREDALSYASMIGRR